MQLFTRSCQITIFSKLSPQNDIIFPMTQVYSRRELGIAITALATTVLAACNPEQSCNISKLNSEQPSEIELNGPEQSAHTPSTIVVNTDPRISLIANIMQLTSLEREILTRLNLSLNRSGVVAARFLPFKENAPDFTKVNKDENSLRNYAIKHAILCQTSRRYDVMSFAISVPDVTALVIQDVGTGYSIGSPRFNDQFGKYISSVWFIFTYNILATANKRLEMPLNLAYLPKEVKEKITQRPPLRIQSVDMPSLAKDLLTK